MKLDLVSLKTSKNKTYKQTSVSDNENNFNNN